MTDFAAFFNDPTLRPALIGLFGVGVGGLMTVTGQTMNRRSERLHRVKEEVANVIGLSHSIRSTYSAYHSNDAPEDVQDRSLELLTVSRQELHKNCNKIMVVAPRSIGSAAKQLAETHILTDSYAHPAIGQGLADDFQDMDLYSYLIMYSEESLTGVTRSLPLWRLPYTWLRGRRQMKLANIASSVATRGTKTSTRSSSAPEDNLNLDSRSSTAGQPSHPITSDRTDTE